MENCCRFVKWKSQGDEFTLRVLKACSPFYACTSSLLIKPEFYSKIGSYRRESTFFWLWNDEEHPFIYLYKTIYLYETIQNR